MHRAQGRDLRRMGDDQHLRTIRQILQTAADGIGGGPADPAINLVKDHDQRVIPPRQADLQRQQKAGQFATGGDLVQRSRRCARVSRHRERHGIAPVRPGLGGRYDGAKDRTFHLQRHQFSGHGAVQPGRGLGSGGGQRAGRGIIVRLSVPRGTAQVAHPRLAGVQTLQPVAQLLRQPGQIVGQDVMLSRQGTQREQTLLGRFQRVRIEIQRGQRVLDPAGGLAQLDQRA